MMAACTLEARALDLDRTFLDWGQVVRLSLFQLQ